MNRKVLIGLIITIFIGIFAFFSLQQIKPADIENAPEWISLELATERAAAEDRLIMIDIYETGCQFCKAMEREVFPAPAVRAVLDRDYVPVKINGHAESILIYKGEQMTAKEFAQEMGVTAYPFTVLMDANGNVVDSKRGYQDVVTFSRFLRSAIQQRAENRS
jgi:thioredoxin-related protein